MNRLATFAVLSLLAISSGSCLGAGEVSGTQTAGPADSEATVTAEAEAAEAGFAEMVADDRATTVVDDADSAAAGATVEAGAAATVAARPTPTLIPCAGAIDCEDFPLDASAQEYWERCGRPALMDRDLDGQVCEEP